MISRKQVIPLMLYTILTFCLNTFKASGQDPVMTGEFPFEDVNTIFSGPFINLDRSDLLVVQGVGGLAFESRQGGVGMGASRLELYSFDGSKFQRIWKCGSLMLGYSLPIDGPISAMTWCYGDFDGDGRYSIITCNVREMRQYTFDEKIFEQYQHPIEELIKTPDAWIDQLMACDIDNNGIDELIALEFPNNPDSCCRYHLGIYKIVGDKPAGRSLVEIWSGLDGVGGNNGLVPPNHFISKCHIDGIIGEVPVMMGMQSDMSLSIYDIIIRTDSGDYERRTPFPKPPQLNFPKGDKRAAKEKERVDQVMVGPVGGIIFNDGDRLLHFGSYLCSNSPDPHKKLLSDNFAVFENNLWRPLQKLDPSFRGLFTPFTTEPKKSGWLNIRDGKYYFYEKLPISK